MTKWPIQERRLKKSTITKHFGSKIENLIKEYDLLVLEDTKQMVEKSDDKVDLSKGKLKDI